MHSEGCLFYTACLCILWPVVFIAKSKGTKLEAFTIMLIIDSSLRLILINTIPINAVTKSTDNVQSLLALN